LAGTIPVTPVRRIVTALLLSLLLFQGPGFTHSGKARYHVVIDTDGALDDLRALCLFLASADIEILAIITSDGILDPRDSQERIEALLMRLGHEGIPIGRGVPFLRQAPPWRELNRPIPWIREANPSSPRSESANASAQPDAMAVIRQAIRNEPAPVIFICMGALTHLARLLNESPDLCNRIEKVLWYNDSLRAATGTNHALDPEAARIVLGSSLVLEALSTGKTDQAVLDEVFLNDVAAMDSSYARIITDSHGVPSVASLLQRRHLRFWDDLLPVRLLHPACFAFQPDDEANRRRVVRVRDWAAVKRKYLQILRDRNRVRSRVFEGFPVAADLFAADVRPFVAEIIQAHGPEEWRLGVLTHELHGHLGIYAVIGTKMGLRAREYFHVGIDDISVFSHAGSTPPLSCLNDGLQVSTGGTVGHGLFHVKSTPPFSPEATFAFKGMRVRLKLKNSYGLRIMQDIKNGVDRFGANTEPYWRYIRERALRCWLDWDRREIFEIRRGRPVTVGAPPGHAPSTTRPTHEEEIDSE